jgi:hypothetical protein
MSKYTKLVEARTTAFVEVLQNNGWHMDSYGNLKINKDEKTYRIKFLKRVARYEVRISDGSWLHLYSCKLEELFAYVNEDGKMKMKNWSRSL